MSTHFSDKIEEVPQDAYVADFAFAETAAEETDAEEIVAAADEEVTGDETPEDTSDDETDEDAEADDDADDDEKEEEKEEGDDDEKPKVDAEAPGAEPKEEAGWVKEARSAKKTLDALYKEWGEDFLDAQAEARELRETFVAAAPEEFVQTLEKHSPVQASQIKRTILDADAIDYLALQHDITPDVVKLRLTPPTGDKAMSDDLKKYVLPAIEDDELRTEIEEAFAERERLRRENDLLTKGQKELREEFEQREQTRLQNDWRKEYQGFFRSAADALLDGRSAEQVESIIEAAHGKIARDADLLTLINRYGQAVAAGDTDSRLSALRTKIGAAVKGHVEARMNAFNLRPLRKEKTATAKEGVRTPTAKPKPKAKTEARTEDDNKVWLWPREKREAFYRQQVAARKAGRR